MSDEIVFYTNPMSRGRIVRWMLEEVGQPYRTEIIEYANAKAPEYLAINPMGKVPALTHNGVVVTECAAICAYLADAFPGAGLAPPPGSIDRAPYYRWLFFAAGPIEAASTNRSLGMVVPAGREVMIGYGSYETVLNVVEQAVSASDYLAGGTFSAADVYLGSQLSFGLQFGSLEKRPAFVAYVDRLTARPAYQRASDLDNAAMAPRPPRPEGS
jgi:glutathione S-transferase